MFPFQIHWAEHRTKLTFLPQLLRVADLWRVEICVARNASEKSSQCLYHARLRITDDVLCYIYIVFLIAFDIRRTNTHKIECVNQSEMVFEFDFV